MQDNQATSAPTGFSWYTGNGVPNTSVGAPSIIPIQQVQSGGSDSKYQIPVNYAQGAPPTHIELPGNGQPININAQEVIINNNNGSQTGGWFLIDNCDIEASNLIIKRNNNFYASPFNFHHNFSTTAH